MSSFLPTPPSLNTPAEVRSFGKLRLYRRQTMTRGRQDCLGAVLLVGEAGGDKMVGGEEREDLCRPEVT
ncbi:MAG: hypothetical protein SLRJCFUN_002009 [Candidatus Fervidibacter sp.]